ncbi:MAG TPA: hypothetical protein VHX88_12790 [Solirubrobacteraceae bacterium]|nr:hypothetical protein [Solirubrobacteraceae bacterium]
MRRPLTLLAALLVLAVPAALGALPAAASASDCSSSAIGLSPGQAAPLNAGQLACAAYDDVPPPAHRLTYLKALAIASRVPSMKKILATKGNYGYAFIKGPNQWQVSFYTPKGVEVGQVIIDDPTEKVVQHWTGFQVAWTMARGYPGAFGQHVNALYVWIPLCVLFAVPFVRWRRPFSLQNLDIAMLLFLSVSLAFFNHANLGMSVPLTYPTLVYLLVRMLALAGVRLPGRAPREAPPRPLRLSVPASWLAVATIFLLGFRVGLNVTDSNVIDVGYAGVIGGSKIVHDKPLYGNWPSTNQHGDTYGPVNYLSYVPFVAALGYSGRWDSLPAAHAASIFFDLLSVLLIFLLGRRVRGPTLGIALAYAWVAYPFTLFSLESNTNDALVGVLVLAALYVASSPPGRGIFTALGALMKFAPLWLVPVMATHGLRERPRRGRVLGLVGFAVAFVVAAGLVMIPAVLHDTLHEIYERTIAFQDDRGSPFSLYGLYAHLTGHETPFWSTLQRVVQVAGVLFAIALAFLPRRPGITALAACSAAIIIAVELGLTHWFYLYVPWFFGAVMLALLGRFSEPSSAADEPAAAAAQSRPLVVA